MKITNEMWRDQKGFAAEMMKRDLGRPQVGVEAAKSQTRPVRPAQVRVLILKRKLGFAGTDLPAELVITERQGKWFNAAGREIIDRAALLACYHNPDARPEPRFGRIAGHTRSPKPLTTNWPKPYQANGGKSNLWRFESRD
jgi:hypothetical protein